MADNSLVLFFNNNDHGWWVKNLQTVDHGIRGYVPDGCFWMDYYKDTYTINICIADAGSVRWETPINTIKNKKLIAKVNVSTDSKECTKIVAWADSQPKMPVDDLI